jgi:uncharacterized glyoxalase superfamily protein PhnB
MPVRTSITPCLVYENAPRAIDFLCDAFGFTRHLVVPGEGEGAIAHAQLVLDGCMVMLSSARRESRERFGMVTPAATGGLVTSCLSVAIADPDAHYARAVASGAKIIGEPQDNEYGGRSYQARDLEGNAWSFGSYDPWAA